MEIIYTKSNWKDKLGHYYFDNKSNNLVVVLPGLGYQATYPILYYVANYSCEIGFDVFSLSYGFEMNNMKFNREADIKILEKEVLDAMSKIDIKKYESIVIVGKSIGTTFIDIVENVFDVTNVKRVYLTPPDRSVPEVIKSKSLFVYGTNDPVISTRTIERIRNSDSFYLEIIDGNHILEIGNITEDLKNLSNIIKVVGDFIVG